MIVLARITGGDTHDDLQDFTLGHTLTCPDCKTDYRVFYSKRGVGQSADSAQRIDDAVKQSHPDHPSRIFL